MYTLDDSALWNYTVALGINTILYATCFHKNFQDNLMFFDSASSHLWLKYFPRLGVNEVDKGCFQSQQVLMMHMYRKHYFMTIIYFDANLLAKVYILDSAQTDGYYIDNVESAM